MRYLILFLLTLNLNAQNINISVGADIRNSLIGSKPTNNKPELNYISKIELQSKKASVSFGIESFKNIGFERYFIGAGCVFNIKKINVVYSIEVSMIDRYGDNWGTRSNHLSLGGNLDISYPITKKLMLGISSNILRRTDLKTRYPEIHMSAPTKISNFLKITYIIKLKNPCQTLQNAKEQTVL